MAIWAGRGKIRTWSIVLLAACSIMTIYETFALVTEFRANREKARRIEIMNQVKTNIGNQSNTPAH